MGKKSKEIRQKDIIQASKTPKALQSPERFYNQNPVWSFSCCDFGHNRWGFCSDTAFVESVLKRLNSFEGQTWGEILSDTSGRNGNTKNHPIETYKIIREAQTRLNEINMSQYDILYSLTISGKSRLWGGINQGVFLIVWVDKYHEICPNHKRHT